MRTLLATVVLLASACAQAVPPSASETASRSSVARALPLLLSAPRAAHTATRLGDGRVLIVGGFGIGGRNEASTELFDPGTSAFRRAASLDVPRYSHTATSLVDGRVLVAGGYTDGGVRLSSALLYDPSTDAFSPTGALLAPRADHSAVRLRDGRVLLAGGTGPGTTFLSSAEIYDPRSGQFAAAGAMSEARESNTITLLADGRVLVAGGHHGRSPNTVVLASAEIFDPATLAFGPTGAMAMRRHKHDAVRIADGTVLILGGADERDDKGAYTAVERYEPEAGMFAPAPATSLARYKIRDMTVLLPDGRVLLTGGATQPEVYAPDKGALALVPTLGRAPVFGTATLLVDGRVLVAGGYSLTGPSSRDAWLLSIP